MGNAGRDRAINQFSEKTRNQRFIEIYTRLQTQYNQAIDSPIEESLGNSNQKLKA